MTSTINDFLGRQGIVSAFGEQVVGFKDAEIISTFNYFINPKRVITTNSVDSFSATIDTSRLKLTAGISGSGTGIAESKARNFYRPGYDAYVLYTAAFDNFLSGTTQEHGIFDDDDGYSIGLNSDNQLEIKHYRGGSLISTVPQSEFLINKLNGTGRKKFTINPQAMNIYYIQYGYLGVLPSIYCVYGGISRGWIPFHYTEEIGINGGNLIIENPFLPLRFKTTSLGNEVSMYSGSWNGGSIAPPRTRNLNDQFTLELSNTFGTGITPVLSIRNETTFKGKPNGNALDLHALTASLEGNKNHALKIIKNGVLTGDAFATVNADSIAFSDTDATAIADGELLRSYPIQKEGDLGSGALFEEGEIRLHPGEWITIVEETTSTTPIVRIAAHWDEMK